MDFQRLEGKIDKLDMRLDSIDVTLAKQHESLKQHIRRTELLEAQMAPVNKHVMLIEGIFKLLGVAVAGIGTIAAFAEISAYLKGLK